MTHLEDLDPKARAIVDAGRAALRATAGDRARVESALRARLGEGALPLEPAHPSLSPGPRWQGMAKLAVGVVVVAGAALVALRPPSNLPTPARPTQQTSVVHPASSERDAAVAQPPTDAHLQPSAPTLREAAQPSVLRAGDRLAQEVALLSRATAQLRAGQPDKALRALDEHQRKFPRGALREDRRSAKAQALCLMGQVARGQAELALLPPQSPAAARAAEVCAAQPPTNQPGR